MNADLLSCDVLEKLPLFEGMNVTDLRQLAEIAVVAVFEPGENVPIDVVRYPVGALDLRHGHVRPDGGPLCEGQTKPQ